MYNIYNIYDICNTCIIHSQPVIPLNFLACSWRPTLDWSPSTKKPDTDGDPQQLTAAVPPKSCEENGLPWYTIVARGGSQKNESKKYSRGIKSGIRQTYSRSASICSLVFIVFFIEHCHDLVWPHGDLETLHSLKSTARQVTYHQLKRILIYFNHYDLTLL